jgi:hypothetical protein
MNAFGELFSFVPNDTGKTFLAAGKNTAGGGQSGYHQRGSLFSNQANNSTWKRLGASLASVSNIRAMRQLQDDSGYLGPTFPSPVDQGLMLTDNLLVDYTVAGAPIIGKTPGAFWVLANQPFQFTNPAPQISGVGGLEGRTLAMVPFYVPNAANHQRVAFDIIGPWEYN